MKTLPLTLLALTLGSAQALEISYTDNYFMGGGSGTVGHAGALPLFDVTRPEIPDDAVLTGVRIEASIQMWALYHLLGPPGTVLNISPTLRTTWYLLTGHSGAALSYPKTITIPASGEYFDSFTPFFISTESTVVNLNAYTPQGSAIGFLNPQGRSEFDSGVAVAGITVLENNISAHQSNYRVTYTYGVPDGGSTLPLLLAGLISCRWIASRRC